MKQPNIIYILADDMGYGDLSCLNPDSAFQTPNLDRLANEGMTFTDAHSSSSVCTPSRYSIMTGRYCWRTYLKQGVIFGAGKPLIEPGRETVASMLKKAEYQTACIGKWHLGWDWAVKPGCENKIDRTATAGTNGAFDWIDYSSPISNGPTDCGFDHFYGIIGSLDMPPYVYVKDNQPVAEPTAWATKEEFFREGPRMESLHANSCLEHLTNKAVTYINEQSANQPFFLYFPITAPHTPIAPAAQFKGRSKVNDYADFCLEVDHRVGQVLDALESAGLVENTIVIFTADNGASAGPSECKLLEEQYNHFCSYMYRGYKSDIWDGGHRLPFLVRWPAAVAAGSTCDQPIGIFDLLPTAAEVVEIELPSDASEDACSFLPLLKGQQKSNQSRPLVYHSFNGMFALRDGDWKLCRCPGSGGWGINDINDEQARKHNLPEVQLYNVADDPQEQHNLQAEHPDKVKTMTEQLHKIVISGRSTPGPADADSHETWDQINWLLEIPEKFILDD